MDTKRQELLEAKIKERFWQLGQYLENAVKTRQAHRREMEGLRRYEQTYTPEELDKMRGKMRQEYKNKLAAIHAEIAPKLDDLEQTLAEKHGDLDLNNPAWQTALQMLQAGVNDAETVGKINASFAHNQTALKALREVYKRQGIHGGDIEKMIYDIPASFDGLRQSARLTFLEQRASINTFAENVGRVARLEGRDFETRPDPDGFLDAFARGAGLAVTP